jgi:iron(III) transport system ATP-binding protein
VSSRSDAPAAPADAHRADQDAASRPAIRIRNLVMYYASTLAVDHLDMDVADGEMLVLLGPSGCGKTTTMRCIAGLETPTAGHIEVGGVTVFDAETGVAVPPNRRDVGMVFQSYAIWPHKTVFQNVAFPLRMQGVGRRETAAAVEEMLELVGLAGLAKRGASNLSGGQMQRIALARSLVMRPRVLLLDEPLSNLDAKLRERLRFELKEIQQRLQVTSIYVTHDQTEALALADRIAVMNSGRIAQFDVPQQLYECPRSAFVADFMGYTNIWNAERVGKADGRTRLRILNSQMVVESDVVPAGEDDPISVCIRPEALVISDGSLDAPGTAQGNTWQGEVVVASYLGTHIRYRIKLAAGPVVEAVSYVTHGILRSGSAVSVSAAPSAVTVLGP